MDYLSYVVYVVLAWAPILLLFLLNFVKKSNKLNPKKLPPGPPRLPIFGNLFSLGSKPHIALSELAKTYGPLMSLQLGELTAVIVSSSALAKEVLLTHDLSLCNRPPLEALRVANLLEFSMGTLPVGPRFRMLRKICNTYIFSSSRLDASRSIRRDKVSDLLSFIEKSSEAGQQVEIVQATFTTNLNLLSSAFFSMDLGDPNSELASELRKTIRSVLVEVGKPNLADFFPILKKLDPQGIRRRSAVHWTKLMNLMNDVVDQRLQGRKIPSTSSTTQDTDVLDTLLSHEVDEQVGTSYIPHLLMDLVIGGTDTVSATIEWAMTELLRNPEKLKKAKAELHNTIGKGIPVEESDTERLPYLQAIIKETLRLHPPVPLLIPRQAQSDVNLLGFTIPKNARVMVNAWAIGRDPDNWNNPNSFEPERFLGSDIDVIGHHFEVIPFGSGRRTCPGIPLATRMLPFMLASLIHTFDWKLQPGISPESINMEEKFGIALAKAQPLRVIPVRL